MDVKINKDWFEALSSSAPVPGGGGASALAGAGGAALCMMVANLTVGKKKYAEQEELMKEFLVRLEKLRDESLTLIEEDAKGFEPLAAAYSLPSSTDEEKAEKEKIMASALVKACEVPIAIMEKGAEILDIAVELADCIIRVLDYMGKEGFNVDALLREAPKAVMCDVPVRVYAASLGDRIARWHLLLSLAYACWCNSAGTHAAALRMALCICEIVEWAEEAGVDMEMVLDTKHEYNKTRPYRHGGKAL